MQDLYLAFDIGGTDIKSGLINAAGAVIGADKTPTQAHRGGAGILNELCRLADLYLSESKGIKGVAVSTAGQVDIENGVVFKAGPTIPNYAGTNLKNVLEKHTNLPVEVDNDVNCVALAEKWIGGCQNTMNFVALTLGTGIGGALFLDGALYRGHSFSAGEWGYMDVHGRRFEDSASISALVKAVVDDPSAPHVVDGEHVFRLYDQGHPSVKKHVKHFLKHLAIGIHTIHAILNPEMVVIGGGVTKRGAVFQREVHEAMLQMTPEWDTPLTLASSGNHAGMVGAVYHFRKRQGVAAY
ncbi:ROK family protein [Bacillaceae bacterium SIJ1]|uniref:ROK family protein n=1 Tax=Litoribacterium kuwaitense TaxID=1398745 RepID=UPI0013EABDB2|nr:ROK family protein [Litoribacterium kuwaitense]NGP45604.1 ROK family protein [Litoribacterium kuwaitense]